MYKCTGCGKNTEPNQGLLTNITKRPKVYIYQERTYNKSEDFYTTEEKKSEGWEIEKEVKVCKDCHETSGL